MAEVALQRIVETGLEVVYSAAANGQTFRPGEHVFIHAVNGSGADVEVTIATPGTVAGLAIADRVVDITAGESRMIGPISPALYAGSDGLATLTWEALTTVTVACLILG